jgi:hypothetical protein
MNRKLHEGSVAEIKDLFDGTYTSIRYLAKLHGISNPYVMWIVDYHNRKEAAKKYNSTWKRNNLERFVAKQREYYQAHREELCRKARENNKKKYLADPEKYRARSREIYHKNKLKINK